MNFTLALLAGLVLLLPGITALVSWNVQGTAQGAKRPELQLTSVTALFVALGVAIVMHVLGYGLVSLFWSASAELGQDVTVVGSLIDNPYEMAVRIAMGANTASPGSVETFLIVTLLECLLACVSSLRLVSISFWRGSTCARRDGCSSMSSVPCATATRRLPMS